MRSMVFFPVFILCLSALSSAEEQGRIGVGSLQVDSEERSSVLDNSEQIEIGEIMSDLESAFNSENVEGYARCFKSSIRRSVRKKSALFFASGSCSMDIEEFHVVEISDDKAELAVRYQLGHGGSRSDLVSTVKFIREDGFWVVESESLVSKNPVGVQSAVSSKKTPEWDPYDPDQNQVSKNLQHLIGDIGVRPGMGCADGKCANGRCVR